MAGIRPQQGGAFTGVHIALVVFVVLAVGSWIGLVIVYTGWSKLDQDRRAAIDEFDKVASRGQFTQYQSQAKQGQTVLGWMAGERGGMAKWISGSEGDDLATVQQRITDGYAAIVAAGQIENAKDFDPAAQLPLVKAIGVLADSLGKERGRRVQAESSLKQAQDEQMKLTQARDGARQEFDRQINVIETKIKETQEQLASYQKAKDAELETLKGNAAKAEEQLGKERDRHNAELAARDTDLTQMRSRLNDALGTLKQLRGQPDSYAAAKEVDGKIIRALPGDPYVYVNLGARDRVTLGMTFAVYNAGDGIPTSGQGKATIEITSVYDDVAAGKIITRNRNLPVLEGDLIANAIYSKNRKHKFFVAGRFDLDGSGVATTAATDRVKAMVQEWGGEVVDAIETGTDFVVLGQGPAQPIAPAATASPIDKQRYQDALKVHDEFQAKVHQATELMIPILNQAQFLYFVGYNLDAMQTARTRAAAAR